ncbi:unnamed protein product [Pedinophyceae sp. YPF-701]|nr:unnamed protein product [Pedinophyceae sp. YPF-701]
MPGNATVARGAAPAAEPFEVDREKTCPLLLRVFPTIGGHHRLKDYEKRGEEPKNELQIYTWMDASLREITELIQMVHPAANKPHATLSFATVYPDKKGINVFHPIGRCHASKRGRDDDKTLKDLNFQIGDFLDVGIFL